MSMKGWRRKEGRGRPVIFRTWFGVWCEMKGLSIEEFSRLVFTSTASVERWRAGHVISRHMAMLIKAFFPDAPIHSLGGPVARITEPLPMCARTKEMYKFIFRIGGLIDGLAYPAALAKAREIGVARDWRSSQPR